MLNISQSIETGNQAHATRIRSELLAVRRCSTLDDLLDLSDEYLLRRSYPAANDRSSIQRALQVRHLELRGPQRCHPLRDLVGPVFQVQEVERRAIEGRDHVQMVVEHPDLGMVVVLFREGVMKGLALLVPGAQIRMGAYPTVCGLGFRVAAAAHAFQPHRGPGTPSPALNA